VSIKLGRAVLACLATFAVGCSIDADFSGTGFLCSDIEPCPSGFVCQSGRCVSAGDPVDADLTMPDADLTMPDADLTLPDADLTLPDADLTLPDADLTLPDADLTLPDAMPTPDAIPPCNDWIGLLDDFADGTPTPQWIVVTDSQTTSAENGELVMTLSNNAGRFATYTSVASFNLSGSRLFVEVPQAVTNTAIQKIRFGGNGNNFIRIQKINNNLVFEGRDMMTTIGGDSITYNSTNHRWWQLRESAGTLFAEVSTNGISFTQFASMPTPSFIPSGVVRLEAGTPAAEAGPGEARFDNINGGGIIPCS